MLVLYISYQDFLTFWTKHPGLHNIDYYNEFTSTPKGTVRYWKMKATKSVNTSPTTVDTNKKSKNNILPNVIPPQGKGSNGSLTQNITELKDKIKFYKNLDPDDFLILGMTKQIEIDPSMFAHYIKQGLYNKQKEKVTGERYIYKDPDWLYNHQKQGLDYMERGNLMTWGMRQLTGKTTMALLAIYKKAYEYNNFMIVHISASKDLSKELIAKTHNDPRLYDVYKNNTHMFLRESIVFTNGSKLIIRPCKLSAVQGLTGGVLWIDELDKILMERETRDAFAALLPVVITYLLNGIGYIWITSNQAPSNKAGGLEFEYFKTILLKFGNFFPVCEIMEPTPGHPQREMIQLNDFDPMIPDDPVAKEKWYINFIYELQEAIAGEEFAKAQMLNLFEDKTGLWRKMDVIEMFESFDIDNVPTWDHRVTTQQGIDPGAQHGTGFAEGCMGLDGHIYIYFVEKYFHTTISEDRFKQLVIDRADEGMVDTILCESSYGGLWWIDHFIQAGYNALAANFGTANIATGDVTNSQKAIERHYKERVLKDFMEKKRVHIIKHKLLFREFSLYNPTENKEKGKGDILDAVLHLVFSLAGGVDYVISILEEQGVDIAEDAYVG